MKQKIQIIFNIILFIPRLVLLLPKLGYFIFLAIAYNLVEKLNDIFKSKKLDRISEFIANLGEKFQS